MPVTRTHTKTYVLLDPWASTIPWDCLVRDTRCCNPTHDHSPMVGDPCAVEDCRKPLVADETCYAVVQYGRITGPPLQNPAGRVRDREQWVCWRHVRPDDGPIKVDRSSHQ
jgi:hypothetical protein